MYKPLSRSIVLVLLILGIAGCTTKANQQGAEVVPEFTVTVDTITEVEPTYEWHVLFSQNIDEATIDNNIFVKDAAGNRVETSLFINSDKNAAILKAPTDGYIEGAYSLIINTNVKSSQGQSLVEDFEKGFTVLSAELKDEISQPKDDEYKEAFSLLVGEKHHKDNVLYAEYVNLINNGYPELVVISESEAVSGYGIEVFLFNGTEIQSTYQKSLSRIDTDFLTIFINKLKDSSDQFNFIVKNTTGAVNGTYRSEDYFIFEHTSDGLFEDTTYNYSYVIPIDVNGNQASYKEETRTGDMDLQYLETIAGDTLSNQFEDEDVLLLKDVYNADRVEKNKTLTELLILAEQLNPTYVFTPEGYLKQLKILASKGMVLNNGIEIDKTVSSAVEVLGMPRFLESYEGGTLFAYSDFSFIVGMETVSGENIEQYVNKNSDEEILVLWLQGDKTPQLSVDTVKKTYGEGDREYVDTEFSGYHVLQYKVQDFGLTFYYNPDSLDTLSYIELRR